MKLTDKIEVFQEDCMAVMSRYPDKYFDLAVCDVNYGIGEDGLKNHSRGKLAKPNLYTPKEWDKESVKQEVLDEIRRVSKYQIIWGANHFISKVPFDSSCWIVWDKLNGDNDFADCELAWTNFDTAVRRFTFRWAGMLQGNMKDKEIRIHPTQKPIALYDWIFKNYSEQGMKILDTHGGSMSSVISADKAGLYMVCAELDREYFDKAVDRFQKYKSQYKMEFQ